MALQADFNQARQLHPQVSITKCFALAISTFWSLLVTKEQEAAASAYYDPRAPNSAFVQQPQFYENPPSYSEVDHKKNQWTLKPWDNIPYTSGTWNELL